MSQVRLRFALAAAVVFVAACGDLPFTVPLDPLSIAELREAPSEVNIDGLELAAFAAAYRSPEAPGLQVLARLYSPPGYPTGLLDVKEIFVLWGRRGWEIPVTTESRWSSESPWHEVRSRSMLDIPVTDPYTTPTSTLDIVVRFADAFGHPWVIRVAGVPVQRTCGYPQPCP